MCYLCRQINKSTQKLYRHGSNINWAQYLRGNRLAASLVEELLTSFNSFVTKMKELASRGNDKGLGDWLDNQDVCQILNISPRTLQTLRDNGTLAYSSHHQERWENTSADTTNDTKPRQQNRQPSNGASVQAAWRQGQWHCSDGTTDSNTLSETALPPMHKTLEKSLPGSDRT